jgi:glucose-1-phosphate adenylyltransferase
MLAFHQERRAEATVAAIPVPRESAREFGVIEVADGGRIIGFHEKIENPPSMPGHEGMCLASMGNYIFQSEVLLRDLAEDEHRADSQHDFGRDVLPRLVQKGAAVFAYDFATNVVPGEDPHDRGYWRDVGTVDAYWEAQMDLIEIHPQFNLYNFRWPIRTGATHDPPAKFVFRDEAQARVGIATDSMVSHGCIISGGRIHRSVLGVGCRVNSFSEVEECVLFEQVRVGRHAKIRRAIIDKDVEIPAGTVIGFDRDADQQRFFVTEQGTVVIPKRAKLDGAEVGTWGHPTNRL